MFPLILTAALATAPVALPVNSPAVPHVDPMETRDHRTVGNLQDDLYGGRRSVTSFDDAMILGNQRRPGIDPDDVGHRADRRSVGNLPDDPMNDRGHRMVFSDPTDRPSGNGGSF
jgi:hypothetical protein